MTFIRQTIPMVSVNDDVVTLVVWHKNNGDYVKARSVICEIETTKSIIDIEAECDGYLFHLIEEGRQIATNEAFAVISETNDPTAAVGNTIQSQPQISAPGKAARKWTKKAEIIAKQNGIDVSSVPVNGIIQEADVKAYLGRLSMTTESESGSEAVLLDALKQRILVVGGGYGAAHIIDAIKRSDSQTAAGILDDNESLHGTSIGGVKIIGGISQIRSLLESKQFDAAILSFGNINRRESLFNELMSQGVPFANIIDRAAHIHSNVLMGVGNVLLANSRIATCTSIGDNNFLSAFVNLDHHNTLGNNCTFGPGVMTSGRVSIGSNVLFGTGIFIEPGISIGSDSIISSGSVITVNIPENSIVKRHVDIKIMPIHES